MLAIEKRPHQRLQVGHNRKTPYETFMLVTDMKVLQDATQIRINQLGRGSELHAKIHVVNAANKFAGVPHRQRQPATHIHEEGAHGAYAEPLVAEKTVRAGALGHAHARNPYRSAMRKRLIAVKALHAIL